MLINVQRLWRRLDVNRPVWLKAIIRGPSLSEVRSSRYFIHLRLMANLAQYTPEIKIVEDFIFCVFAFLSLK